MAARRSLMAASRATATCLTILTPAGVACGIRTRRSRSEVVRTMRPREHQPVPHVGQASLPRHFVERLTKRVGGPVGQPGQVIAMQRILEKIRHH